MSDIISIVFFAMWFFMFEAMTMIKKQKAKAVQKKKTSKVVKKSTASKTKKKTMFKSVESNLKQFKNYKEFLNFLIASDDDVDCETID